MRGTRIVGLAASGEALVRKLTDRFKHREPGSVGRSVDDEQ
jgi:hypothetical protein